MSWRARHSSGRSAVESVTTAKERLTREALFDREDERVVLLAAQLDLDLEAGVARADLRLEARHLRVRRLLAAVHGHELVGVRAELAERLLDHVRVIAARELEPVVDQPDDIALLAA